MYYDDEIYLGTPDDYVKETYNQDRLEEREILDDRRMYDHIDDQTYKSIHENDDSDESEIDQSQHDKSEKEMNQEIKKSVDKKSVSFKLPKKTTKLKIKINKPLEKVAPSETSKDESNASVSSETKSEQSVKPKTIRRRKKATSTNGDKQSECRKSTKRSKKSGNQQEANTSDSTKSCKGHVAVRKGRSKGNARGDKKQGQSEKNSSVSIYEGISQFFSKRTQRKYSKLTKNIGEKAGRGISRFIETDGKYFNEREIQALLTKVGKEFPIYCMLLSELLGSIFLGPSGRENIKRVRTFLKKRVSNGSNRSSKTGKV